MITAIIVLGIIALISVLLLPYSKNKTTTYAFQVYDNLGRYVYTKRVSAMTEFEAEGKIKKYIPKDYTYKIVFP